MKPSFLSVQATYSTVQINLYHLKFINSLVPQALHASSHLISCFDTLLQNNSLTLNDMHFIAIDKGPGAFTSLRAAIASVNGIAFAHKIPLIGINSLQALAWETIEKIKNSKAPYGDLIVTLLNAYNNDVYFLLTAINDLSQPKELEMGCCNINLLIEKLNGLSSNVILITGNGAELHYELVKSTLTKDIGLHHVPQATPTAGAIGALGLKAFMELKEPCFKIEPLYLKTQNFAIRNDPNKPSRS